VLPVGGEEIAVDNLESVVEFQGVETLQCRGEELQRIRRQRAHEDPGSGEHQHLLVGGETFLHEVRSLQKRINTLVIRFFKQIRQVGVDSVHQVENLALIHGDADILRHVTRFEDFTETPHGLLGSLHIQSVTFGGGKDNDNAALRGELLVNLLILAIFLAIGQKLGDVLLVAHPRGEEREQGGQRDNR